MANTNPYSEHAETLEAVLSYVRRANRLSADDGDEFASWARLKLLEDDCAVFRKFRGDSTFKTFVVIVIQRLFLDWRIREWGKWRPTADARRLGPVAIELERLVLRDQIEYEQAVETLVSKGIALTRDECDRVWSEVPRRPSRQRAPEAALDAVPALPQAHDSIVLGEHADHALKARAALAAALNDAALKERTRSEVDAAIERGVFGSPYMVIDGEPFWGADRFAQAERWLEKGPW